MLAGWLGGSPTTGRKSNHVADPHGTCQARRDTNVGGKVRGREEGEEEDGSGEVGGMRKSGGAESHKRKRYQQTSDECLNRSIPSP